MPTNESALNQAHVQKDTDRAQELRVLDRNTGTALPKEPMLITGTCLATDLVGMCLYQTGGSSYTLAVPSDLAKMPAVVLVTEKTSDTSFAGRLLSSTDEVKAVSGLTAGSTYVVGSDGYPATVGDSNYPAQGSQIQYLGSALGTSLLLLQPGLRAGGAADGAFSYAIVAAVNHTNTVTETTLASYSVKANNLKAGSEIDVEIAGIYTSTNSTDTSLPKLYLGSSANMLGLSALDVANNDLLSAKVKIQVRTSTTAIVSGWVFHGTPGTAVMTPIVPTAITIDTTADQTLAFKDTWSVASASNNLRLDVFSVKGKK